MLDKKRKKRNQSRIKNKQKKYISAYILQCCDNTFYIGSTTDLIKRIHAHNHWKSGAHYTKIRRPVKLVYQENFATFSEAMKREAALKKLTRLQKTLLFSKTPSIKANTQ